MAISDRRSGQERRATDRYAINIDVDWETSDGRKDGTISDISLDGCFIMCSAEVNDGEVVKVFLPIADGMKAEFRGVIVNHVLEIGFAMRFDELTPNQVNFLNKLIEGFKEKN